MSNTITTINDIEVFICEPEGEKVATDRDALDIIGEAIQCGAETVVIPVERLPEEFFQLKSGLAGHLLQKFVNYRRRLVIVGDISQYIANSRALRDFVRETNRGSQVWFIEDLTELDERLNRAKAS